MSAFLQNVFRLALVNLLLTAVTALYAQGMPLFKWPGNDAQMQYIVLQFLMTGWIFPALFGGLLGAFPVLDASSSLPYKLMFALSQVGSYGMVGSLICQGMGASHAIFALFFAVATIWMMLRLIRDTYGDPTLSRRFLVLCLIFLVLSSNGPYILAWMEGTRITDRFFQNATYFFFHIGYNGWITFGIAALVIRYLEMRGWAPEGRAGRRYFRWMAYSALFTFFLYTLWGDTNPINYVLAGFGSLLQIGASVYLMSSLAKRNRKRDPSVPLIARRLFLIAGIAYLLKITLQMASSFPAVARIAHRDHPLVLAYLYEVLIAFVTCFFLAWAMRKEWLPVRALSRLGIWIFLVGFFALELIISIEGVQYARIKYSPAWFQMVLFVASVCMAAGVALLVVQRKGQQA